MVGLVGPIRYSLSYISIFRNFDRAKKENEKQINISYFRKFLRLSLLFLSLVELFSKAE